MESMNRDHLKEKDTLNSELIKLKDELRKVKSERIELEKKCHNYEKVCFISSNFITKCV